MTVTFLTSENNGYVKVQNVKDLSNSKRKVLRVNPSKTIWVKLNFVE